VGSLRRCSAVKGRRWVLGRRCRARTGTTALVGEDAAVKGDEPVAVAVGRGRRADDRLGEGDVAGGAVGAGVAVGENAAAGGDEPSFVPTAGARAGSAAQGMTTSWWSRATQTPVLTM
jgi:hypothetical protein